jgi:hypothetical protein
MTHTEYYKAGLLASMTAEHIKLYQRHLTGEFDWSTMSLYMIKEVEEHGFKDTVNLGFFIDWLLENQHNTLPFTSSGSFLTALKDIDNICAHFEVIIGRELTDDDFKHVQALLSERLQEISVK